MSTNQNQMYHQLRLDLQNELTTTNQLLHSISHELQQIKEFSRAGGEFENNVKENASTMQTLGSFVLNNVDIENINPIRDDQMDTSHQTRNASNIDNSRHSS